MVPSRHDIRRVELLTRHGWIPVHKHAVRIVPPCPDVQLVERGKTISIRTSDVLEVLTHKHRRRLGVSVPGFRDDQELDAYQAETPVSLLVYQQLGMLSVENAVFDQIAVCEMDTHRAFLGPTHTTSGRCITDSHRHVNVPKGPRVLADLPDESCRGILAVVTARDDASGKHNTRHPDHTDHKALFRVHRVSSSSSRDRASWTFCLKSSVPATGTITRQRSCVLVPAATPPKRSYLVCSKRGNRLCEASTGLKGKHGDAVYPRADDHVMLNRWGQRS